MIKDKLTTTYELVIRPDYQELISLVASMNNWNGEGDPKDFLAEVVNDLIKRETKAMIRGALERYYGLSQAALVTQAMLDYDQSAETNSEWSEIDEE